jgi:hypothetical protein
VAAALTAIGTELVASGWTDNTGNSYTSPVDAVGRFITANFLRESAQTLSLEVFDQLGQSLLQREARIDVTAGVNNLAHIFTGQFHVHIEFQLPNGTGEFLCGGILDLSPEAQDAHTKWAYGGGTRANGGTVNGDGPHYLNMYGSGSASNTTRIIQYENSGIGGALIYTKAGNYMFHPREVFCTTATVTMAYCGRTYQSVLVTARFNSYSKIKIPIDGSTLGTFLVSGMTSRYGLTLAIRIA